MPPPNTLIALGPGVNVLEDDGDPYNNMSQLRRSDGTIIPFEHPTASLELLVSSGITGATLVINLAESLGTAVLSVGSFTVPEQSPAAIIVYSFETSRNAVLISTGSIAEGSDADAEADIVAGSLVLSAATGIGSAGNPIEMQISTLEAETNTGGIHLTNYGDLAIDELIADVEGVHVADTGDVVLTSYGSIGIGVIGAGSGQTIRSGENGGGIDLRAIGYDSDILQNAPVAPLHSQSGSLQLRAGGDIILDKPTFGGAIYGRQGITIEAGGDFMLANNVLLATISNDIVVTAGRNISLTAGAGIDTGFGDVLLTTDPGGTFLHDGGYGVNASGDIRILADRMLITSDIRAPFGAVTLAPVTAGRPINVDSTNDISSALELSDAELDGVYGRDGVVIGSESAGRIAVTGSLDPELLNFDQRNLTLRSGGNIDLRGSIVLAADLTFQARDNVTMSSGATIDAETLSVFVDTPDDDPGLGALALLSGAIVTTLTSISGGVDDDTLHAAIFGSDLFGLGGNDLLRGSSEGERLEGGAGNDRLFGNGGDDVLAGGAGGDVLDGAGGTDTADYTGNFGGVSVNLATGVGQFNFAHGDTYTNIEDVIGTEYGDILTGNAGVNFLVGNGGNDTIMGGAGADNLNGGAGVDTLTYAGNFGGVSIDLQSGAGLFNYAQGDFVLGFENVIGTEFTDILRGDGGNNRLEGNGQNDQLTGRNGNDVLDGGLGADALDGGLDVDTADYAGEFGAVFINLITGAGQFNSAQGDTLIGIEKVIGTSFGDIFWSNNLANVFTGGAGHDEFVFNAGFSQDAITDFAGNGAAAGDTVRFAAGLFANFADMISKSAQVGSDVVITLNAANTLTLKNTTLASLDSSDFIYG